MFKILVTDSLGQEGLDFLAAQKDVEPVVRVGVTGQELLDTVRAADALIVRSATKVTAEVLADPGNLRVVARAGVGVDNIDLDAATRAGVLVVNTPDSNTISTAELAMAHMLALARKLVPACNDTRAGGWDRKSFSGTQLAGKTLGVVGYGRIGRAVAQRALAMEMNVAVFDPFFAGESGGEVAFCENVQDLMRQADIITVHTPLTPETKGMIGEKELAMAKPGLLVVNCARGGIVDEQALADAVRSGRVAGAGVDVYTQEPPKGNPLIGLDNVLTTPHLGASTAEAQAGVALEACRAVLGFLREGDVRGAVNVAGMDFRLDEKGKGLVDLSQRMGRILACQARGPLRRLKVTLCGEAAHKAGTACARFLLVELLQPHLEQRVNVVNAVQTARQREVAVEVVRSPEEHVHGDLVEAQVSCARPEPHEGDSEHSVAGSVLYDGLPHVWQIDGYRMDMIPAGQVVIVRNADEPGAIGVVGTLFGNACVNIADMSISRRGKTAMMVIRTDGGADKAVLDALAKAEHILDVRSVELPPLPGS